MRTIAVIGANFGDEGKGRMVDHFTAGASKPIVVRFNGGPQAGHTVVTPEGREHVFHHFGAGTLAGSPTFLSRFFMVNPILWRQESVELGAASTKVYIDPAAPLTTPYDMLLNREAENQRGNSRHGSCGYGIGETVERLVGSSFRTFYRDLSNPVRLAKTLGEIRDQWVPVRLKALGISKPTDWFTEACASGKMHERYLLDAEAMRTGTAVAGAPDLRSFETVVFEGAQGLCLDEGHKFFPHVTRSRTGIANVAALCKDAGIEQVEAVYVTRAYLTRHGNGPLPTEGGITFEDRTNTPNDWQGTMRFGHLSLDLLGESVRHDVKKAGALKVSVSLAVTCLDQVGDACAYEHKGRIKVVNGLDIPAMAAAVTRADKVYTSCNRSRQVTASAVSEVVK